MAALDRRPRFSALTRRIILFKRLRAGGPDRRRAGGAVQPRQPGRRAAVGHPAAGADRGPPPLAEYSTDEYNHMVFVSQAKPLLRQLIAPSRLRARLYDTNGRLLVDSRYLLARNVVQIQDLPPIDWWDRFKGGMVRLYEGVMGVRPFSRLDPYFEAGDDGRVYGEVTTALGGDAATAERVDEANKLVLSVAVPIQRFKAIYGVLLVSTEGGDIDDILREERATLIQVFLVAVAVMVISLAVPGALHRRADPAPGARRRRGARRPCRTRHDPDHGGTPRRDRRTGRQLLGDDARALRPHRRHRAFRRRRGARIEESAHLAQERGGDAGARRHRRTARAADGHRAQRRQAHRPPDHRHLRRLAPRRRAQPRNQRAGRSGAPAGNHRRGLPLHRNLEGHRRRARHRPAAAGPRPGPRRKARPGVPQPDRQRRVVQRGRRQGERDREGRERRGLGDGGGRRTRHSAGQSRDDLRALLHRTPDREFRQQFGTGPLHRAPDRRVRRGRIWAENRESGGARFIVELPLARA